ncbi:hypothetical protein RRG08_006589 [Elysia crispata]|uniref:Uncharacterized protein n=1 Tax=Elysia crispata TaxID=231223 RepID=A0AAE0YE53_9GAST|nr:hypothetical protein RRG08_006589 [Elysia crispata]
MGGVKKAKRGPQLCDSDVKTSAMLLVCSIHDCLRFDLFHHTEICTSDRDALLIRLKSKGLGAPLYFRGPVNTYGLTRRS